METFSALLALCAGNSPVPVNSSHKGKWRGALMFSLICAQINDWVNNRETGDLRRRRGHCDVIVMWGVVKLDRPFFAKQATSHHRTKANLLHIGLFTIKFCEIGNTYRILFVHKNSQNKYACKSGCDWCYYILRHTESTMKILLSLVRFYAEYTCSSHSAVELHHVGNYLLHALRMQGHTCIFCHNHAVTLWSQTLSQCGTPEAISLMVCPS